MFNSKKFLWLAVAGCLWCLLNSAQNLHAQNIADPTIPESPVATPPAEDFRVLPPADAEGPQITPYLFYQTALAWQQDALRQARWSHVKSEGDLLQLQGELRNSVLEMIGGLPSEKTDLHPTITGRISANGFHVEKLIYQSLPGFYVTALVYVPDNGSAIHPAVLVAAGHSPQGKIHYQDLCQRLVKRGYLVLSWDPVGQGERSQFWDAQTHRSRYNLICAEHAVMGNLAYLAGTSLARWEVWDGIRAVDYLLTRNDVDGQRISLTGTSGGGFQAALLGALDQRIKVVIPSCYITALPMRVENRIFVDPDSDPEQDLFGLISKGVDHAGLLLMMYPRPVMVATAALDFFPVQGSHKTYTEVSSLYERFGRADRIAFAESYNMHQFSLKNQEAALNFLDRFNGMPVQHGLPPVTMFNDADLQVTKSGQVSVDYPSTRTVTDFIETYFASHHETHSLAELYRSEQDPGIYSWTVKRYTGSVPAKELRWEPVGTSTYERFHIDRYILHHSTYLQMPVLHFYNDGNHPRGAALWLSLNDKAGEKDWPQILKLLSDGYEVYSFDFRGLGETRMHFRASSPDDPDLVKGDFDRAYVSPLSSVLAGYVYNSLLTGRPYFLQLMDDIRIANLFVRDRETAAHLPPQPVTIAAAADTYGLALRFRALDPEVKLQPMESTNTLDWSTFVLQKQEQWPIAFLLPSGAFVK